MGRQTQYRTPPASLMNTWVREAIVHWGGSHAELARRLAAYGIGSGHRSLVQKMTVDRAVKAHEMLAISRITGFPPPHQ